MQTLGNRNTYTPINAPQIDSNCDPSLNKEATLSAPGSKTFPNNPKVDKLQQVEGRNVKVLVLSVEGNPLMPCTPAKARKLLKAGRAVVVRRIPFTIKLTFECENQTQGITVGMDTGYSHIGFSCCTDKEELMSGEVVLDNKTSTRLTERRMYRRGRRNKLRYRQARFLNRKKPKGWLPPSVQRRVDTHIRLVEKLSKWLPITKVNIELGSFDIQKINNPDIEGVGYQQGNLYDYENTKAYVVAREKGKCQLCGSEWDKQGWHLHHIIERSNGGTDRPDNLALLHEKCHDKLHRKGMRLKPNKQFKAETFMSTARWFIYNGLKERFPNVNMAFGCQTKIRRNEIDLPKSHINDAFVIAGSEQQERCKPYLIKQKHRNNRSLGYQRNGFAPATRRQRYKIQPGDLVWVNGKPIISKGCQSKGKAVLLENKKTIGIKKVEKYYNFGSFVFIKHQP